MTRRLMLAGTLGSLVAPMVAWAAFVGTSVIVLLSRGSSVREVAAGASHFFWFFVIVGVPLTFTASALAIPFVEEARSAGKLTQAAALRWGAMIGGVTSGLVWSLLLGPMVALVHVPGGAMAGAVAGWIVARLGWRANVLDAAASRMLQLTERY